jgi:transposase
MEDTVTMSSKELQRAETLALVVAKRMSQQAAAELLGLTTRQLRRLQRRYEVQGGAGLVSGRRGRPSNRRLPVERRAEALRIVRDHYADFGPTLAHEKLTEVHGLRLSVETLRRWMVEDGLWLTRAKRRDRVQQPRHRRACVGELIQIDGSDHEWFEARAERCTLLVYIDDASGRLMHLHFCEAESTFAYFAATRRYLELHGKPVAFYSDKATVFRVNAKEPVGGDGFTQFGRAMHALNIDSICANPPAAKGRVERANLTLQDRLVKELRLAGVSDMDAANRFAPVFIEDFNRRFAKTPASEHDAHRPLAAHESLDDEFRWQETRKVSRQMTLNYKRVLYRITPCELAQQAVGNRVLVSEADDGAVRLFFEG